jgi:hypothetical protein
MPFVSATTTGLSLAKRMRPVVGVFGEDGIDITLPRPTFLGTPHLFQ